ncbi:hypothetical protein BU14_0220s0016 [Porphyra umbilicalis]|uniref:Uncharacterized protein n=1 Tax=Porphyra umbilicalis TaxID=2786 RepID=A0A1X6P4V5_PORUM|nr:hypothetical protein BU14_0220s0016 [Porphyra umbilicalis]|eukprot:OSX75785.1 hypothetical protein BU14_0220s0016 [Porphyra umbilicalis]
MPDVLAPAAGRWGGVRPRARAPAAVDGTLQVARRRWRSRAAASSSLPLLLASGRTPQRARRGFGGWPSAAPAQPTPRVTVCIGRPLRRGRTRRSRHPVEPLPDPPHHAPPRAPVRKPVPTDRADG